MSGMRKAGEDTQIKAFTPREILRGQKRSSFESFAKENNKHISRQRKVCFEKTYMSSVSRMWGEFKTKIISGAITAVAVIAICAVVNMFNWSLGYEVIVDGENIGLVTDKDIVYTAIENVRTRMSEYLGENSDYEKEPVFVRRVVAEDKLAKQSQIEDALFSNMDAMVEAYAVYVDGEALFGLTSQEAAEWVFAKYKQKFTGEEITDDMIVDFCEETEINKEYVHIALLETPEDALEILSGGDTAVATYKVKNSDTLWDIAKKYDTTVEHLLALNDHIDDNIKEGMEIKVEETVPRLSVRSVQTVSLTEPVPYTVEKIKDGSIYEGRTVVSQKGKEGSARVLAKVTKVNGVEIDKNVLESETLTQPVVQIEKVGTKKRPPTTGSGTFINPSFGTLSSRYGRRWGRNHNGIDIAGSYNSPIKAADGGVVTYSGWMSGYGNYVIINHENGYQTAYGHCASLDVNVGDRVAKGDVIAKMGSTGRSTGTHLHFEVRKNGQYVDPLKYVGY
ncbi:MAG: peptidoglycan DD-metalloendopeptidase family protein [Clostridia bacterium]|nr:peptidoglycan DD-metalloendopeptidase family protein [Clostridia bacterium]